MKGRSRAEIGFPQVALVTETQFGFAQVTPYRNQDEVCDSTERTAAERPVSLLPLRAKQPYQMSWERRV